MTLGLSYRSLSVDLPVEVRSRAAATAVSRRNNNDDNGDDDDDDDDGDGDDDNNNNNNMMSHEPNVEMIYQWNAAPKRYRCPISLWQIASRKPRM